MQHEGVQETFIHAQILEHFTYAWENRELPAPTPRLNSQHVSAIAGLQTDL